MKTKYDEYTQDGIITVFRKTLFTDVDGFPNELAFRNFIEGFEEEDQYYLACINIDLTASNESRGYEFGTSILKKVYQQISERFFIFRIGGDKFNVLIPYSELDKAEKMLNSGSEMFAIYYGIETEIPVRTDNFESLRKKCIDLMYNDRKQRSKRYFEKVSYNNISVGPKKTASAETPFFKPNDLMCYAVIDFDEEKPIAREVKAYVFPVEYKEKMMSVRQIVVVDDFIDVKIYTGNSVVFGFDGIKFNVTSRFDDSKNLKVVCFKEQECGGQCKMFIKCYQKNSVLENFGKSVGENVEIFPVKPNSYGTHSYVLWDKVKRTAQYEETGIISIDNENYAVTVDDNGVSLILQ